MHILRRPRRRHLPLMALGLHAQLRHKHPHQRRKDHAGDLYPHRPRPPYLCNHYQPARRKNHLLKNIIPMQYYSLNNPASKVSFKEATLRGQAPDKGLYFPASIPRLSDDFINHIDTYSREEIAFNIIRPYTGDTLPETELRRIVAETVNFDFPLVPITPGIHTLELFHG